MFGIIEENDDEFENAEGHVNIFAYMNKLFGKTDIYWSSREGSTISDNYFGETYKYNSNRKTVTTEKFDYCYGFGEEENNEKHTYSFDNYFKANLIDPESGLDFIDLLKKSIMNGCDELTALIFEKCNLGNLEKVSYGNDDFLIEKSMPDKIIAYMGKSAKVVIPENFKIIGDHAFCENNNVEHITVSEGVVEICTSAFEKCKNLKSITIPESITVIEKGAFEGCTSLKSITLPEKITKIEDSSFNGCTSLESITLPESIKTIGDYSFNECTSLKSITLPEGVTEIYRFAFFGCTGLTRIVIPASVIKIGEESTDDENEPIMGIMNLLNRLLDREVKNSGINIVFGSCENLTIYTPANSYAENYAKENGIKFETINT